MKYLDHLPNINAKETKKEVERHLLRYRDYLITFPTYLMPKVTPTYSIIPPTTTNEFHSSTENAAIERIEYEKIRNDFIKETHDAVNTLKEEERHIIIQKYMLHGEIGYDREIMMTLGYGKTKYSQIKGQAVLRLAFTLKIEVYKKSEAMGA